LRWSRADTHSGSGDARGGRATRIYPSANEGRYSDPYRYRVAYACRYAASNLNGDAFPRVRCYAFFTHPDTPADGYDNEHADAPADANAGSHAHTNLASDDLRHRQREL
jgi:hypothetical protein